MTLNNLKEALILNNIKLLEKIKTLIITETHKHDNKNVIDKFSQSDDNSLFIDDKEIVTIDMLDELKQEIEQLKEHINDSDESAVGNVLSPIFATIYAKQKEITAQVNNTPVTSSAIISSMYAESKSINTEIRSSHMVTPIIAIDMKEV